MKIKVLFVCLGNICRSPLGEGIFKHLVTENNLEEYFEIDSCGTSAYHVGEPADARMREVAYGHGVLLTSRARQFSVNDLDAFDYILAMDHSNFDNIHSLSKGNHDSTITLMRNFDLQDKNADVPDPYYGGLAGFENVYSIVYRSCEELLKHIRNEKNI